MDLLIDGLWNASSLVSHSSPLRLINSVQNQVKSAPRRVLRNLKKTCPVGVLKNVLEPASFCKKVPFVGNVWKKLNVAQGEWYNYLFSSLEPHPNEDIGLTTVDMIKRNGYPVEVYEDVVTEDGYVLELYRIPYGRGGKSEGPKPVVLLVHGFMTSSADYLVAGPGKALAYLLADLGYDVWLGNPRGSLYSRKHKVLDPDCDNEFWKFSFHEIGIYDLPAMIDYILATTHQENLTYVGMSQGTAVFFTLASEKPEYNQKINLMIAMAPIAHLSSAFHLVNKLGPLLRHFVNHARDFMGPREFPNRKAQEAISNIYSKIQSQGLLQDLVVRFLFALFGPNHHQLDTDILPVLLSTVPHSSSLNQLIHFGQIAITEKFQKFDHGSQTNLQVYGTPEPPEYNLENVKAPVAIIYSNGDLLSRAEDVLKLHSELPNCVCLHEVEDQNFNHMDYFMAIDIVPLLQKPILNLVAKFNPC